MRATTRAMAAAAFMSVTLVASACGGGGAEESGTGNQEGAGQAGGEITVYTCTPENALVPSNTNEECGSNVVTPTTAKLVRYDTETTEPINDIAQSIETTDNQNFTVKIKPDYKFHDGSVVKAKNFVDAWNFAAYGPNGQGASYFFQPVQGYADVSCTVPCTTKPKTDKLSGLKVVDDTTFTIKTTAPVSNLPVRLGYTVFAPLPDAFFKDQKAFEAKPIGAGPFKLDSKSNTEFVLSKFADYSGELKPNVDKVTLKVYQDSAAAYAETVANQLDFVEDLPPDQLVGEAYKSDLPDRSGAREAGRISYVTFSPWDPQMKGNPDLHKALSMAIDRNLIADKVFNGTVTPAKGWVSPVVAGYKEGACKEFCNFDPVAAKALYEKSGGYQGTLTMTFNADGAGNKEFSEALCNSVKNTLGVDCRAVATVDFATFNKKLVDKSLKGMFRSGWVMDYPSIENFLTPVYGKGADSNYSEYNKPAFEKLIADAGAAKSADEANTIYQQAEAMLVEDFPTAPLWFPKTTYGFSENVTDVKLDAFDNLDLVGIKRK